MLTRLEIDGFKNLFGVVVEFGPFTCIAGPNGVGKSNLFDAIEFLSLLTENTFMEAAQKLRSAGERLGDPRTLFWYNGESHTYPMKFAAEMIVAEDVEDEFGQVSKPRSTFLRYELELSYEAPGPHALSRFGSIRLVREDLNYVTKANSAGRLKWEYDQHVFRDRLVKNNRWGKGYISTDADELHVHQDGGSRGQPRKLARTQRTVVSTINTVDDPTILAARREMQQWRVLALEPSAMRSPDRVIDGSSIGSDGSHLAAALYRLSESDSNVFARVASTASSLVDVREVRVDYDASRELLTLEARIGGGPFLPARAISDGSLRFLALSIIESDAEFGGVICMEEPENGIHPAKMRSMSELLKDIAVDPVEEVDDTNPLRQVIVNTHSPRFVGLQDNADLLLALPLSVRKDGAEIRSVDFVPISRSWRHRDRGGIGGSKRSISEQLVLEDGSPLELDFGDMTLVAQD